MENVSGSSDPFYRYKMPSLTIQNQSNKTVLTNIDEVAKALDRTPTELIKMFGYRRHSKHNTKNNFLGGKHNLIDLKADLQWYIQTYIMCPACDNPETIVHVSKKSGKINLVCQACPETSAIKNGDAKLNKYYSNQINYPTSQ